MTGSREGRGWRSPLIGLSVLFTLLCLDTVWAQHRHLEAGALGTEQGDALYFVNSDELGISSGYVMTLRWAEEGRYAGYFQGGLTLTVLPATANAGGPDPHAPAPGSFIQAGIASVHGPPGGEFGFWEAGATEPTESVAAGSTGSGWFAISDSDRTPGSDPFGHIHGRRFTATQAGLYRVGFRLVDTSTHGAEGGPIHAPSDVVWIHFQAGLVIASVVREPGTAAVTFGTPPNRVLTLESSTNLVIGTGWLPVADPVLGDEHFQTVLDRSAVHPVQYYRVREEPP
jgi:hypothetical protein